jgi:hypothetical protein
MPGDRDVCLMASRKCDPPKRRRRYIDWRSGPSLRVKTVGSIEEIGYPLLEGVLLAPFGEWFSGHPEA